MKLTELRYVELASLQRPLSGCNRRLHDKEIAICSSAFQSCDGSSARRFSELGNCQFFQLPLRLFRRLSVLAARIIAK
jgi:hypothetical protein